MIFLFLLTLLPAAKRLILPHYLYREYSTNVLQLNSTNLPPLSSFHRVNDLILTTTFFVSHRQSFPNIARLYCPLVLIILTVSFLWSLEIAWMTDQAFLYGIFSWQPSLWFVCRQEKVLLPPLMMMLQKKINRRNAQTKIVAVEPGMKTKVVQYLPLINMSTLYIACVMWHLTCDMW